MTDAEFRKQKARILKAFNRWRNPTGMDEFVITHHWHREGLPDGKEDAKNVSLASANAKWEYLYVDFHWNLREFLNLSDNALDRAVRHEIAHALVAEMREYACESDEGCKVAHEERVVSKLAFVLNWCRLAGEKDARKPKKKAKKS